MSKFTNVSHLVDKKDNKLFLHFCLCDNSTDRKNQQKLASVHCWVGLFGSANKFIVSARQQTIQTNERTKEGRCRNVTVNLQPTHASTIAIQRHTQIDVSFQDRSLNSGLDLANRFLGPSSSCLSLARILYESRVSTQNFVNFESLQYEKVKQQFNLGNQFAVCI